MDEFLIEKYIEMSKGISINISSGIGYADPDPHSYSVTIQYNRRSYDKEHTHIFIAKDIIKKLTL